MLALIFNNILIILKISFFQAWKLMKFKKQKIANVNQFTDFCLADGDLLVLYR